MFMAGTKTFVAKPGELKQDWWVVDATDQIVGRIATEIAMILMGKTKPTYTPHVDMGDFVIVTNASKVKFTGRKWQQKEYAWFTGYTRQRRISAEKRRDTKPELILKEAVRRMLPKNKLATKMLARLKIFPGADHPHQAQQPKPKVVGAK
jgi:large subunit ribosomal protein L13